MNQYEDMYEDLKIALRQLQFFREEYFESLYDNKIMGEHCKECPAWHSFKKEMEKTFEEAEKNIKWWMDYYEPCNIGPDHVLYNFDLNKDSAKMMQYVMDKANNEYV